METEYQRKRAALDAKKMELKIEEKECDALQLEERAKVVRAEVAEMKKKLAPSENN